METLPYEQHELYTFHRNCFPRVYYFCKKIQLYHGTGETMSLRIEHTCPFKNGLFSHCHVTVRSACDISTVFKLFNANACYVFVRPFLHSVCMETHITITAILSLYKPILLYVTVTMYLQKMSNIYLMNKNGHWSGS